MAKKGDNYECGSCGMVVVVDKPCDCASCGIMCCGVPMEAVKPKAKPKVRLMSKSKAKK